MSTITSSPANMPKNRMWKSVFAAFFLSLVHTSWIAAANAISIGFIAPTGVLPVIFAIVMVHTFSNSMNTSFNSVHCISAAILNAIIDLFYKPSISRKRVSHLFRALIVLAELFGNGCAHIIVLGFLRLISGERGFRTFIPVVFPFNPEFLGRRDFAAVAGFAILLFTIYYFYLGFSIMMQRFGKEHMSNASMDRTISSLSVQEFGEVTSKVITSTLFKPMTLATIGFYAVGYRIFGTIADPFYVISTGIYSEGTWPGINTIEPIETNNPHTLIAYILVPYACGILATIVAFAVIKFLYKDFSYNADQNDKVEEKTQRRKSHQFPSPF